MTKPKVRYAIKELALGAWVLLALGLTLNSFVLDETRIYALCFVIAGLTWFNMERTDRAERASARDLALGKAIGFRVEALREVGMTEVEIEAMAAQPGAGDAWIAGVERSLVAYARESGKKVGPESADRVLAGALEQLNQNRVR